MPPNRVYSDFADDFHDSFFISHFLLFSLLLGGGYHGKSTLLNALKVGIYNKVPGDGREFVVTDCSAISIRSEDGRYVAGTDDS